MQVTERSGIVTDRSRESASQRWFEKPVREVRGHVFQRFVIRTHLVRRGERLERTLAPYLLGALKPGDIVVLGEKIVAIAEGRAVRLSSVKPRRLARFLSNHVRPLGYGIGFRRPETMEMAIREVGSLRILLAAVGGAFDRFTRRSGDFYRIAGRRVAAIDGPGPSTIPPYNQYIVLAPKHPEVVIAALARRFGCGVAVVDVNDVGSEVLAVSKGLAPELIQELMRDNPMGQGAQGTPLAVLRPLDDVARVDHWPETLAPVAGGWPLPAAGLGDSTLRVLAGALADDHEGRAIDL
jgi:hypothetical protein